MHEVYIRIQDYQCWYIIENGDYEIYEKEKSKWAEKEFKLLEKNAKPKQLILNGLSRGDVDKEIWKAIQVIHAGSVDQQNLIRHDLLAEFVGFSMTYDEDISEYHSRFQRFIDTMKGARVNMEHLNPSLSFIRGVDFRFSTTKCIVLMSADAQNLSVVELAGKFELNQRDQSSSSSSKTKDPEENGTTLKLQKVLKAMRKNKPNDSEDRELVLMS